MQKTAAQDLQVGTWYRTNLDLFSLLRVNKIRQLVPPSEQAEQDERFQQEPLVEFDLFSPEDGAPVPMLAAKSELDRYGLKPADRTDFEELDLEYLLDCSTLGPFPKEATE
jgi:hypothetical protein